MRSANMSSEVFVNCIYIYTILCWMCDFCIFSDMFGATDCRCVVMWGNLICHVGWFLSIWGPRWSQELPSDNTSKDYRLLWLNMETLLHNLTHSHSFLAENIKCPIHYSDLRSNITWMSPSNFKDLCCWTPRGKLLFFPGFMHFGCISSFS